MDDKLNRTQLCHHKICVDAKLIGVVVEAMTFGTKLLNEYSTVSWVVQP